MSDRPRQFEIGDRVRIGERSGIFVVVELNDETDSVSVVPESDVITESLDKVIPAASADLTEPMP